MSIKEIRIKNSTIYVWMLLFVFVTSFYVREPFFSEIAVINLGFIFLLVIYLYINRKVINYKLFLLIVFIMIYILVAGKINNDDSIISMIKNILVIIAPLFLLTVRIREKEFKEIFYRTLKVFNFFILLIFIIGLIDPIFKFKIMTTIGKYITPTLSGWIYSNARIDAYRYTSFMGHPLFTKELFLMFYLFNNVYFKKFNEYLIKKSYIAIISVVGVLLTGSKSGIVLMLVCLLFTYGSKIKVSNFIYSFMIILVTYQMGFFNNVLNRFKLESLTTGRYEMWNMLSNMDVIKYRFFCGYGEQTHAIISQLIGRHYATAALEYPLRILALNYGVLCTILILIVIFIRPIILFLKKNEFYILFIFIIKVIDSNTYNGLIYKADNMILFVIFTALLIGSIGISGGMYEKSSNNNSNI